MLRPTTQAKSYLTGPYGQPVPSSLVATVAILGCQYYYHRNYGVPNSLAGAFEDTDPVLKAIEELRRLAASGNHTNSKTLQTPHHRLYAKFALQNVIFNVRTKFQPPSN